MKLTITPRALSGSICAPPSKSAMHRTLICAALSDDKSEIISQGISLDIKATIDCLNSLGAKITEKDGLFSINPIRRPSPNATLDCGESGSTFRFLLPIAGALSANVFFKGHGRLPERPISPLCKALSEHGMRFDSEKLPMNTSGSLSGGEFRIPADISSQFISGLLFALPILKQDSIIIPEGKIESLSYINMTLKALEDFSINIEKAETGYRVAGNQKYRGGKKLVTEGDFSGAAFALCAGAAGGNITVSGLDMKSAQGDKKIIGLLADFGAKITFDKTSCTVSREKLSAIDIDASDIPDLVPVLAVIASLAEGKTTIYGAGRLRIKESDRLASTTAFLKTLGADIKELADGLEIYGKQKLNGGTIDSCGDHRIAMAAAIAATACTSPVTILGAQAVNKSYPNFWKDYKALGGITAGEEN